jgi:UDP-N-acetylmuramyl pentapeptide phosphotransferase/UDP-N-acetylglucosamine-1-phosphate transferase
MLPYWLVLHFAIGLAGTWLARRYAIRVELLDHPGERRSHVVPTPRGGGIAIVIALLVAACVLGWRSPQQIVLIAGFAVGLVLVAGVGVIDDHKPLSPWLRLGVQAIAAAILALAVAGTSGDLLTSLIAFAAVMVLTNVWNFMDGINGIAASQAALVAGGLALVLGGIWSWVALALVAACLGFLPFNFPKARIFLGDVGSGALGFAVATLLVVALMEGRLSASLLLLPLAAFLVDSGLTLLRRIVRRERWWTAHAQHAYQRWANTSDSHMIVTFMYAGWTVAGWLLTWWLASKTEGQVVLWCLVWFTTTAASWACLQCIHEISSGPRTAATDKDRK